MTYEFSTSWLFTGLLILIAGILFIRFHRWVADNFGGGVVSYEKYRLYALIMCGVGFLVMLNIHTMLFSWFFSLFF